MKKISKFASAEEAIKQSVFKLLFSYKFFGSLSCSLKRVKNDKILTMATDSKCLYYNEEFTLSIPQEELSFIIAHEVMHAALGHCNPYRRGKREMMVEDSDGNPIALWNVAADYIVNGIIQEALVSSNNTGKKAWAIMPSNALHDKKYYGKTVEVVYAELLKESASWPKSSSMNGMSVMPRDGELLDDHMTTTQLKNLLSESEARDSDSSWKNAIKKEIISEQQKKGSIPGFMKNLHDMLSEEPKVAWRELLERYVMNEFKNIYKLNPPNKRFLHLDMIMPSVQGEHIELYVAADTSGSMIADLPMIYGQLQHIFSQFSSYKLTLYECDTAISATYVYEFGDDFTVNIPKGTGGGGTSFIPVFKEIENNGDNGVPKILIYATVKKS